MIYHGNTKPALNSVPSPSPIPQFCMSSPTQTDQPPFPTGYFQTGNLSRPTNIVPGFTNATEQIQNRVATFGPSAAGGPNTAKGNQQFGGWHLQTTNVFHTNGEYDPWRALSIASDISPSQPNNILTTQIPPANSLSPNGTIFGMVIKNGLHGSDINSYNVTAIWANVTLAKDSFDRSAYEAHGVFVKALDVWLPAYKPFKAGAVGGKNGTATGTGTATAAGTPSGTGSSVVASKTASS